VEYGDAEAVTNDTARYLNCAQIVVRELME
jgi:hypothetical protein